MLFPALMVPSQACSDVSLHTRVANSLAKMKANFSSPVEVSSVQMCSINLSKVVVCQMDQSFRGATCLQYSFNEVPLADHMGLVAQLAQLLRKGCEVDR